MQTEVVWVVGPVGKSIIVAFGSARDRGQQQQRAPRKRKQVPYKFVELSGTLHANACAMFERRTRVQRHQQLPIEELVGMRQCLSYFFRQGCVRHDQVGPVLRAR